MPENRWEDEGSSGSLCEAEVVGRELGDFSGEQSEESPVSKASVHLQHVDDRPSCAIAKSKLLQKGILEERGLTLQGPHVAEPPLGKDFSNQQMLAEHVEEVGDSCMRRQSVQEKGMSLSKVYDSTSFNNFSGGSCQIVNQGENGLLEEVGPCLPQAQVLGPNFDLKRGKISNCGLQEVGDGLAHDASIFSVGALNVGGGMGSSLWVCN